MHYLRGLLTEPAHELSGGTVPHSAANPSVTRSTPIWP